MLNKLSVVLIVAIFLSANTNALQAQSDPAAGDRAIKAQVNKLGTGAKVTVSLKDGTKVKGSIGQIHEDSFDVTLANQTQSSVISYRDVETVKRRGWSTGAKIGLGVGIGAAAIAAIVVTALATLDLPR